MENIKSAVIELIYRFAMRTSPATADIFSDSAVSKLFKGIDSGLVSAQSILVCYELMFILCSAIIMRTF